MTTPVKVLTLLVTALLTAQVSATVDHTHGQIVGIATDGSYSVKQGESTWSGVSKGEVTQAQLDQFDGARLAAAARQRTHSQVDALASAQQAAKDMAQKQIDNYGVKVNPEGHPVNIVAASTLTAAKVAQTDSINVAASTLSPATRVSVTINGKTSVVAASTLAPSTQVAVPHLAALMSSKTMKGGQNSGTASSSNRGGTGNGGNNAANSNSAHGAGGSQSIGGGSAGGGFHY